jgi:hypothetical protein
MDPHISPEGAHYQEARVAAARGVAVDRVRALVDSHVDRSGTIIGAPARVNVLLLNLDLDKELPAQATLPAATQTKPEATPAPTAAPKGAEAAPSAATAAEASAASSAPAEAKGDAAIRTEFQSLTDRVNQLAKRVDGLLPPPPNANDDLKQLEGRVARLAEESVKFAPLAEQVGGIDRRATAAEETLKSLRSELDGVRDTLAALRTPAAKPSEGASGERGPAAPIPEKELGEGLALFQKGLYAQAGASFRALTVDHGDDARAWYLAAVSNGLATNNWSGPTEELVNKGVEREKAGTPGSAEIDAALAGLTKTTGRDWLAFFRQKAKKS